MLASAGSARTLSGHPKLSRKELGAWLGISLGAFVLLAFLPFFPIFPSFDARNRLLLGPSSLLKTFRGDSIGGDNSGWAESPLGAFVLLAFLPFFPIFPSFDARNRLLLGPSSLLKTFRGDSIGGDNSGWAESLITSLFATTANTKDKESTTRSNGRW
eukprot:CAMPEP_0116150766 /NCGR_PEP_ID=MMETSP0329-20121206/19732_1 /TAXON_ID=697910 /ORGANISM="Pseudo-nitzschia arenysensis, Strain B593" /LENGTH=157 /DNA_ID=CAMNT_0003647321 /DNA_START=149 /DNA_END=619 /DNA_ORIENTATION=-